MNTKAFRGMKFLFRFFCFEPLDTSDNYYQSAENARRYTLMYYCWYIVHLIVWTFQISFIWKYQDLIFFTYEFIGEFSDRTVYFVSFLAYFIFQYEAFRDREKYLEIFKEFYKLEMLLQRNRYELNLTYAKIYKKYVVKFIIFSILYFTINISSFIIKFDEKQTKNFFFAYIFEASLHNLKQFHLIFYMDLVNFYLKILHKQLTELTEFSGYNEKSLKNSKYNKFLIQKLKTYKCQYNILFNISELMNEVMGCSLFISNFLFFMKILRSVYWFIFKSLNTEFNLFKSKRSRSEVKAGTSGRQSREFYDKVRF